MEMKALNAECEQTRHGSARCTSRGPKRNTPVNNEIIESNRNKNALTCLSHCTSICGAGRDSKWLIRKIIFSVSSNRIWEMSESAIREIKTPKKGELCSTEKSEKVSNSELVCLAVHSPSDLSQQFQAMHPQRVLELPRREIYIVLPCDTQRGTCLPDCSQRMNEWGRS